MNGSGDRDRSQPLRIREDLRALIPLFAISCGPGAQGESTHDRTVSAFEKSDLRVDEPVRPMLYGTASGWPGLSARPFPYLSPPALLLGANGRPPAPRSRIDNSASASAQFLPVDIRPGGTANLDTRIVLHVDAALAGAALEFEWTATASDADGIVTGSLRSHVSADLVEPELPAVGG